MISYHKTVLTLLSLTAAWAPYFDDMDAIIFLAPIRWVFQVANSKDSPPLSPYLFSCFDQVLEEDNRVNRLVSIFQLSIAFPTVPYLIVGRLIQAMDNDSLKSTTQANESYLIFE